MADEQKKEEQKSEKPVASPPAGEKKPPPALPKVPPKKPAVGPEPLDNERIRRLRTRFSDAIGEATRDRQQEILVVDPQRLLEVCRYLQVEEGFDFLTDLTAVDHYQRSPRYDVILNLYSFAHNQHLRLKVPVNESCPSVTGVWSAADWLERECFDMFGIVFEGHPHLTRILLPDEWKGHPLRKDYDILQQDVDWVKENLGIKSGQ